jgi:hypothetical protein
MYGMHGLKEIASTQRPRRLALLAAASPYANQRLLRVLSPGEVGQMNFIHHSQVTAGRPTFIGLK